MDNRLAFQIMQAGRVGIGVGLLAAPARAGGPWIGEPAQSSGGQVALRALGVRDTLMGIAALRAARRGDSSSIAAWARAQAACGIVDGVATGAVGRDLPDRGIPLMVLAFGAVVAGLALAARL